MKELKEIYIKTFPEKIRELNRKKDTLGKTGDAEEVLRVMAHSMRGSGETYGFPEITEAARLLEKAPTDELSAGTDTLVRILENILTSESL